MSRIGRKPISLPKGVQLTIGEDNMVVAKGPKGELFRQFHPDMKISMDDGTVTVQRPTDGKMHRSLHGLSRTLLNNMIVGVSDGWKRQLQINGVGYRATMEGNTLVLQLGFSHLIRMDPPEHVKFVVGERKSASEPLPLTIEGIDKEVVGQQAAKIRGLRPPEPYKGKGVKYLEETIRRKAGKAGKTK